MFKISVMDYTSAFQYLYNQTGNDDEKYAIISIQEAPEKDMAVTYKEGKNCKAALNLWFSDISDIKYQDLQTSTKLMTEDDALKIKDFIDKIEMLNLNCLIIHCYGGVSRSAAVAAAISKAKKDDDSEYFNGGYLPNMFVYNKVLEAFSLSNGPATETEI